MDSTDFPPASVCVTLCGEGAELCESQASDWLRSGLFVLHGKLSPLLKRLEGKSMPQMPSLHLLGCPPSPSQLGPAL